MSRIVTVGLTTLPPFDSLDVVAYYRDSFKSALAVIYKQT
jgi:hypothetical protein